MAEQIVGRRRELVAYCWFVEALPAGGAALLFEGDAGIGKTALWQEGSRLAHECGIRVLTARAAQSEQQTSFAVVADLFAAVLKEALPRLVTVQRHALEVAFLLRERDGPPPEARLIATALLSIVRILVEERPLLFAIDDAQWVDASSAEILRFVFRRLEAEPVGVLVTVRGVAAEAPFELDRAFAGFRRLPGCAAVGRGDPPASVGSAVAEPGPAARASARGHGREPVLRARGRAGAGRRHDQRRRRPRPSAREPSHPRRGTARRAADQVRETLVAVAALGAPSVTLLEPLTSTAVSDIELACQRACPRARRRPDPLHASAPRARLLRGHAAAPEAPASTAASPNWTSIRKSAPATWRSPAAGPDEEIASRARRGGGARTGTRRRPGRGRAR